MKVLGRIGILGLMAIAIVAMVLLMAVGGVGAEQGPAVEDVRPEDLVFQTVSITATADTTIHSWHPTTNYATECTLLLRSLDTSAAMLKFDLSSVPPAEGMVVAQALLKVYVNTRSNNLPMWVQACAVKRPWVAAEATWVNADASTEWELPGCNGSTDRETDCCDVAEFSKASAWIAVDATDIVRSWLGGGLPNNGIVLKSLPGGSVDYVLAGSDYWRASLRPKLEILFTELPPPPLRIQKTGPSGPLWVGEYDTIVYDIKVCNPGSDDVDGVVVTDVLPLGTEFLSCTSGGAYDNETNLVTWEIGGLGAGVTQTVNLTLSFPTWVKEDGTIVNLVLASFPESEGVAEAHWEIPVLAPTPGPTPTRWKLYLGLLLKE